MTTTTTPIEVCVVDDGLYCVDVIIVPGRRASPSCVLDNVTNSHRSRSCCFGCDLAGLDRPFQYILDDIDIFGGKGTPTSFMLESKGQTTYFLIQISRTSLRPSPQLWGGSTPSPKQQQSSANTQTYTNHGVVPPSHPLSALLLFLLLLVALILTTSPNLHRHPRRILLAWLMVRLRSHPVPQRASEIRSRVHPLRRYTISMATIFTQSIAQWYQDIRTTTATTTINIHSVA
jgi:hypothetical protein